MEDCPKFQASPGYIAKLVLKHTHIDTIHNFVVLDLDQVSVIVLLEVWGFSFVVLVGKFFDFSMYHILYITKWWYHVMPQYEKEQNQVCKNRDLPSYLDRILYIWHLTKGWVLSTVIMRSLRDDMCFEYFYGDDSGHTHVRNLKKSRGFIFLAFSSFGFKIVYGQQILALTSCWFSKDLFTYMSTL